MSTNPESAFRYYVDAVRRRWAAGLVVAASVIAVAVPVALGLPNLYRSSASLMVDQAPDPLGQKDSQMLELSGRLQAIRQEALSRQRVTGLAEQLDIYGPERAAGQVDAIVSAMQREVKVEMTSASRGDGRMTTVSFLISYTGNDPVKVSAVVNRLAQFYVDRNDDIMSRQATRVVEQLRKELDATRKSLDAQEQRVIQYASENAGTLPSQMSSITAKYSQLMQQLQANTSSITTLMDRRNAAENAIAGLSAPSGSAAASDPSVRLATAERELKELLAKFYEENPQVRNKRSEIAGLREQVAAAKGNNPGSEDASQLGTLKGQIADFSTRIETLQKANQQIQSDLDKYDKIIEQAPVRSAEFERYSREASQTRQQFDSMNARYQAALVGERAQQGPGGAEFQVLDPAVPAGSPSAPNRQLLLGLGAVASLVLGLGVILLLDRMDSSFKSVDELRAFTHVPVLATIPRIVLRRSRIKRAAGLVLGGAVVSVALWLVSLAVFRVAQDAEPLTRMLLR